MYEHVCFSVPCVDIQESIQVCISNYLCIYMRIPMCDPVHFVHIPICLPKHACACACMCMYVHACNMQSLGGEFSLLGFALGRLFLRGSVWICPPCLGSMALIQEE